MLNLINDNMFDNLFSDLELALFSNVNKHSLNIKELSKTGDLSVEKEEQEGFVTETTTYISFDKTNTFTQTNFYYKNKQQDFNILQLDEQIATAVAKEDYALAAELKQHKDNIVKY